MGQLLHSDWLKFEMERSDWSCAYCRQGAPREIPNYRSNVGHFGLCASIRLVYFDIGQSLLVDFDLCAPTRLVCFDIGQSLLADFCLCAPTRLVFFKLVSRCWWTLTCAIPLV